MKRKQLMIPAVFFLPLLGGCALFQGSDKASVEPPSRVAGTTDNPESLYQLGRYYQGQNRYEQAIAAYTRALQADGQFSKANNGLGVVFSLLGRYDEAIQALELAISQAPDDAYIYSNLGYVYYLKGLDAQAVATLERAISLDPGNVRAQNNFGLAHARMAKAQDSVKNAAVADMREHGAPSDRVPKAAQNGTTATAAPKSGAATVQETPLPRPAPAVVVERTPQAIPLARSRIEVVQSGLSVFELKQRTEAAPIQEAVAHTVHAALQLPGNVAARIEVSNGNGITGMAKVVGGFLRDKGFKATRLTNQKTYAQETTQVEYRAGFLAEAERLRASLPGEVTLVETKDLRKDIAVRLVLGKDIARTVSRFDTNPGKTRLATWQES